MYYNLFLDDERNPKDVTWEELPPVDWFIVRNYTQFVEFIEKYGLPARISFDHDLGESSYVEFQRAHSNNKPIDYSNITEKTGYHCCKWLIEYCLERNESLPDIFIHSMNYMGRDNIQSLIDSYRRVCNNEEVSVK